jgi:hypothetical protein
MLPITGFFWEYSGCLSSESQSAKLLKQKTLNLELIIVNHSLQLVTEFKRLSNIKTTER